MTIIVITEDGQKLFFDGVDSILHLAERIKRYDVEVIVVGGINADGSMWEKQFKPVTVMPTTFGQ